MLKKLQIVLVVLAAFLCSLFVVQAATVFQTIQGGTGTSSPSGILYGSGSASPLKTVSIGSNLTFSGGTLSATDVTFSTTSANYWASQGLAFSTTSNDYYTSVGLSFSTTSANNWSTFGLAFSTTSALAHLGTIDKGYFFSTTSANYFLNSTTSTGFSTTSANYWAARGLGHSTTSVAYQLSQNITVGNSTSTNTFATLASSTNLFSTFSTTSKLTVTDYASTTALTISGVRSAALITSATGVVSGASATTCTNQFVRSISAVMVGTCATVGAADVSLANLTATNSTLTFSGTYNGSTARTIGINLGNSNAWTALQTFNTAGLISNASTTIFSTVFPAFNRFGLASSSPSALWGGVIGTSTVVGNAQFNVLIASSTTSSANETVNWDKGNHSRYILNTNTNFTINSTSSNPRDGGKYTLEICQDGTGARTATFVTGNTHIRWKNNATTTITSTANKCSLIYFIYEATYSMYRGVGSTTNISIN